MMKKGGMREEITPENSDLEVSSWFEENHVNHARKTRS
jgi:hypothetical protein